ncbi:MAG TPA: hypothetical protein VHP36_02925 [Chitinispirillaceae bacterium]|nr:hypothetical protein [Chitinispirillaceae bacterium]
MSKFSIMGTLLVSAGISAAILSCAGTPSKPVIIEGKGTVALVSYSLNKSIVKQGQEPDNQGPGLLQKAIKGRENAEADYYQDQIEALVGIYQQFIDQMSDVFSVPFMDVSTVTGNESYQSETKRVPKMVMGVDIAPGKDQFTTGNLNFIDFTDKEKLNKLAAQLKADLLMLVYNDANYDLYTGVSGGLFSGGAAKLYLNTTIYIYDPKIGDYIFRKTFTGQSDENIPMVQNYVNTKHFPKCSLSAHQKNLNAIKAFLQSEKQRAAQIPQS